jgi:hypothetical protein
MITDAPPAADDRYPENWAPAATRARAKQEREQLVDTLAQLTNEELLDAVNAALAKRQNQPADADAYPADWLPKRSR